jgi:predicted NBD/HSP70 family sugar kinase
MAKSIGLVITENVAAGAVDESNQVSGVRIFPGPDENRDSLLAMPTQDLVDLLAGLAESLTAGAPVDAVGLAFPGIIRNGEIEDSPNLDQLKGVKIVELMSKALESRGIRAKLSAVNDAHAIAAGIAAMEGRLNQLTRVWTLGIGIGFGHYPLAGGVWEAGHSVVSLDPNETFCGCGGRGHLEGILGYRSMRLRFLDLEPEEVFQQAESGEDPRCVEFRLLWHRALAAAVATSIHLEGPGKFYFTGSSVHFLNLKFLGRSVQEMVKMSPLLSYNFEVYEHGNEAAIVGAAVNARGAGFSLREA